MKRVKLFLKLSILTLLLIFNVVIPVGAKKVENDERIQFITPEHNLVIETEYNVNDFTLEKKNLDGSTIFSVIDSSGFEVESWSFGPEASTYNYATPMSRSTVTYRHLHKKNVGALSGKFVHDVALELYQYNSFAQFNKLLYDINFVEGWSYFSVGTFGRSITPTGPGGNEWPAVGVAVSYSVIVTATLNVDINAQFQNTLLAAGFSLGSSYHYSKRMTGSYIIKSINW